MVEGRTPLYDENILWGHITTDNSPLAEEVKLYSPVF